MPLGAEEIQAIVDQATPDMSGWLAMLLGPQAGLLTVVALAARKRIREHEERLDQALKILIALDCSHKSDDSPFAIAPAVAYLKTLQTANEQQHAFNVWVGTAVELIVRKLGQLGTALMAHGVKMGADADADADLLTLQKPPGV